MSEFDEWFKGEMPNSHKKVNKERIETVIYSCAEASWNHQQAKIDELQARIDCIKGSVDWHIEDRELALSMNKNDVWSGGQLEILRAIKKRLEDMLKGNKDEN